MWNSIGGTASPSTSLPSMSIAMMSAADRLLRTEAPALMRMWSVPGDRQLMWPLKSITSARSIIVSASASCRFRSARVVFVTVSMVVMSVVVIVIVRMRMSVRAPLRPARILTEDERLDRHRDRERRHAHAPQVDVVEIPERDAVDHEHVGGDGPLVLQQRAQRLRHVAVEHEIHGLRLD